jgi:hypothetical protein
MLQMLLENQELQSRISNSVSVAESWTDDAHSPRDPPSPVDKAFALKSLASQRAAIEDRTNHILVQAEKLRLDIATARDEARRQKEANSRKRSDLISASYGIGSRRTKALEGIRKSTISLQSQWDLCADRTAATRGFLCMEAAKLYGLRRVKKGSSRYEYKLGGIDVVDLASMNGMSFQVGLLVWDTKWQSRQ